MRSSRFQPSPTGPVDDRYIVGPGDELRLAVWGAPEFQYTLTVDRRGRVYVPNHGQFTAAGKRLSTLREEMERGLSKKHSGLTAEPQTVFMDLSVARIQPMRSPTPSTSTTTWQMGQAPIPSRSRRTTTSGSPSAERPPRSPASSSGPPTTN